MHESPLLNGILVVTGLFFIAALSAIFFRKAHTPYTIGLLVVGLLLGYLSYQVEFLAPLQEARLSPDIILFLILPTLLFEASININLRTLMRNLAPILVMATIGLLISMSIVGIGISAVTPLTLGAALLFGAMISATDPVAVIALFKEFGVPERLSTLVDGESLFNDATAIVVFHILLGIVGAGTAFSSSLVVDGLMQFLVVFLGGLVVGAIIGGIMLWFIALGRQDYMVQATLTSVMAYLAFIIAEHYLHVSGVMAVVTAGILGAWVAMKIFDEEMQQYVSEYWEYMAFVANSLIFLLMGLTQYRLFEDVGRYGENFVYILAGFALTLIARLVVVYALTPITNLLAPRARVDRAEKAVMFWGGLRGAIPLALVLGLPVDFEHRALLIDLTLGVVLMSLLIQGTTFSPLLKKLKIVDAN